jgi:acetyl esterase/lipase
MVRLNLAEQIPVITRPTRTTIDIPIKNIRSRHILQLQIRLMLRTRRQSMMAVEMGIEVILTQALRATRAALDHLPIQTRRPAPVHVLHQVRPALPRLPSPLLRVRTLRRTQATVHHPDKIPVLRHNQLPRRRLQHRIPMQADLDLQNRCFAVATSSRSHRLLVLFPQRCSILLCVQSEAILEQKPPGPDLRFPYGQDTNQFVDVRIPPGKGPHPIVFFIHGGYWRAKYDLTYAGHLCHALKQAGIATWNIEYRRVGNPGGGWPGTFEDVRSAYRALREHRSDSIAHLDLKKLCVAGHSAGGHLAFCLAAFEHSVTHVLSLAGVLDLRRAWDLHLSNDAVAAFLGGSPADVPDHYREASPAERSIPQATQKLIHGTADQDVPYEISQSYAAK